MQTEIIQLQEMPVICRKLHNQGTTQENCAWRQPIEIILCAADAAMRRDNDWNRDHF